MNYHLPAVTFDALLADLAAAFMTAATSATTDLHDELVVALAASGVMPEACQDAPKIAA